MRILSTVDNAFARDRRDRNRSYVHHAPSSDRGPITETSRESRLNCRFSRITSYGTRLSISTSRDNNSSLLRRKPPFEALFFFGRRTLVQIFGAPTHTPRILAPHCRRRVLCRAINTSMTNESSFSSCSRDAHTIHAPARMQASRAEAHP